jgi:hypothetical protein
MPQPQLKQDYVVMTVSCGNCQQEQLVHVQALTGAWSTAHQSLKTLPSLSRTRQSVSFSVLTMTALHVFPFVVLPQS